MTGLAGTSGVIAPGHSGNTFTYLPPNSAAAKTVPATDTWHQRPASDAYRQEWDSFARDLGVHPHVASSFPVITDALHRYADTVITAAARGVPPRAMAATMMPMPGPIILTSRALMRPMASTNIRKRGLPSQVMMIAAISRTMD
jgi:hypothetical protein